MTPTIIRCEGDGIARDLDGMADRLVVQAASLEAAIGFVDDELNARGVDAHVADSYDMGGGLHVVRLNPGLED